MPGTPKTPVKHKNSVPTGGERTFRYENQHLYVIQIGEKLQKMPAHCEGEKNPNVKCTKNQM